MLQGIQKGIECMEMVLFQVVSNRTQHSSVESIALLKCSRSLHVHEIACICS